MKKIKKLLFTKSKNNFCFIILPKKEGALIKGGPNYREYVVHVWTYEAKPDDNLITDCSFSSPTE